ncbi:protein SON [Caerostris extrusa]|uniref:Protein SON n=1 Tax=Caerostris extrusa TaxID=172846 RepID=A0AAV4Q0B7_CAEEX|nr:protein SON [Caerostris extrusa]
MNVLVSVYHGSATSPSIYSSKDLLLYDLRNLWYNKHLIRFGNQPQIWKFLLLLRDTFACAAPVTEGKGMSLLKNGLESWRRLGKNKEGALVPLMIDIKTDKKKSKIIIYAPRSCFEGEGGKGYVTNALKELQVSALMELCSKRKWKPPTYTIIKDSGPPHKKQFLFKVEVNGVDYQPAVASSNKKVAKSDAAVLCLQALKVFPDKNVS